MRSLCANSRPQFISVMWPRPPGTRLGRGGDRGRALGGDLRARSRSYITLCDESLYLSICWYRLRALRHEVDAVGQKVPSRPQPTNHWQKPTRLDIHASSKQGLKKETVDDGCSYRNQRVCVSGRVFPEYAASHL
jgi:hypothetical protein